MCLDQEIDEEKEQRNFKRSNNPEQIDTFFFSHQICDLNMPEIGENTISP